MSKPRLHAGPPAPPDRGRLMDAETIAREKLAGAVSAKWVRTNAPHKVKLGHSTVRWYERDVDAWLESLREPDAGEGHAA